MSDKTVAVTHITPPDPVRYRMGSSLRESARQAALEMIRRSDEALAAMDAAELTRLCMVCGKPSDAAECTRCVLDDEIAWKRRSDQ